MLKTNKNYEYLDLLALFTTLYLKAYNEKLIRLSKVKLAHSAGAQSKIMPPNPLQDFLIQRSIKNWSRSDHSDILSALFRDLTDPDILCCEGSLASRNIETSAAKRQSQAAKKMNH
jgi:hypothetical protein